MEGGEEEDPSNPAQTAAKTLDHPKHAAMLERLSNRKHHQSPSRKPDHSAQTFLSLFAQSKLSIDSSVYLVRHSADRTNPALKSDLERISLSISDLEKLVAENSYSLPPFELRTCLGTIASLKQTLDALASDMVPKRRFSFKHKKSETPKIESEEKAPGGVVDVIESEKTPATELEGKPSFRVWDSPGFKDGENEVLVREFKGLEMGEFSLTGLSSCEVRLTGCLRALFVHKLRDCKVYVGPVFGSVLIEEVEGCVFVLASHQIRIHHARRSDFYLRVRSRPIIEDCSGVRFAPYCLGYDGIERDLKESNLDEETGKWANVDDFRWLKAVQSPNWSILPESERIGRVTIMNSDK